MPLNCPSEKAASSKVVYSLIAACSKKRSSPPYFAFSTCVVDVQLAVDAVSDRSSEVVEPEAPVLCCSLWGDEALDVGAEAAAA